MYLIVEITGESYDLLQEGKSVVGQISRDSVTDIFKLKAFVRRGPRKKKSKLLCQLPNGKFSESETLYRLYVTANKLLDVNTINQMFGTNVEKAIKLLKAKALIS